jgi:hypothetical protein
MEIVLTAVLVVLTGYQFWHPSVESGAYTTIVYQNQIYRMNTRDGKFELCQPPTMSCTPTTMQVNQEHTPK